MVISRLLGLKLVVKDAVIITDKVQYLLVHSCIRMQIINFQRVEIFLRLQVVIIKPLRVLGSTRIMSLSLSFLSETQAKISFHHSELWSSYLNEPVVSINSRFYSHLPFVFRLILFKFLWVFPHASGLRGLF